MVSKYLNFPCKLNLIADIQVDTEVQDIPHSRVKPKIEKKRKKKKSIDIYLACNQSE